MSVFANATEYEFFLARCCASCRRYHPTRDPKWPACDKDVLGRAWREQATPELVPVGAYGIKCTAWAERKRRKPRARPTPKGQVALLEV